MTDASHFSPLLAYKFAVIMMIGGAAALHAGTPPGYSRAGTKPDSGARIEYVTPDGQTGNVSKLLAAEPGASALLMEDDTVTCLLQEGETNFVVELPRAPMLDRLTFLNENAVARGELKIAISNERLKADSQAWVPVEGIIPFSHKRLFGVSLLGIEAKFVKLSFSVEKKGRVAAHASYQTDASAPKEAASETAKPFASSVMDDAVNSQFARTHARGNVLLTANDASVGPLSPAIP